MPLINPILSATLRRHWPLVGAIVIFMVLIVADQIAFQPAARHYRQVFKQATDLGMVLDPNNMPAILPPRLFAVLSENSLTTADAVEKGGSGTLTAALLEDLTTLIGRHGMQAIVTEPGPVTQQAQSVLVRAHAKLSCRYEQFVALLNDVAHGSTLISVDRFTLTTDTSGTETLDLWVSRYILKRTKHGT